MDIQVVETGGGEPCVGAALGGAAHALSVPADKTLASAAGALDANQAQPSHSCQKGEAAARLVPEQVPKRCASEAAPDRAGATLDCVCTSHQQQQSHRAGETSAANDSPGQKGVAAKRQRVEGQAKVCCYALLGCTFFRHALA